MTFAGLARRAGRGARTLAAALALALAACGGEPAPAPAPSDSPAAPPPAPSEGASAEAGASQRQPQEEPPMSQPTAAWLEERARAALPPDAHVRARWTPPLPAAWPDAGGRVVFFVYGREALPTGQVRYQVRSPRHAVEVDVATGAARARELDGGHPLGEAGSRRPLEGPPGAFEAAKQALVDLVAGRRPAGEARADLAGPYRAWLEDEPLIAADLRGRQGQAAFLAWLDQE